MPHLTIKNIEKRFGTTLAVDGVSLDLEQGEIVCLLGPSGCGKTTLLRLVAGLESADGLSANFKGGLSENLKGGAIQLNGRDLVDVPTYQRGIGMMFQSYALFPHLTVAENIAYGLKMAGEPQALITERISEMLDLVDLEGLDSRRVDQLSGGQQQRVALARSLATRPAILLLDEPLGSLDRLLREHLLIQLRTILKKVGVTALYVTHDQSEAFGIADRVAVMNEGKIEQIAPPQMIYTRPTSRFVANFLGLSNVISINKNQDSFPDKTQSSQSGLDSLLVNWLDQNNLIGGSVLIPPYSASINKDNDKDGSQTGLNLVSAVVTSFSFRGRFALLVCQCGEHELEFSLDPYGAEHLVGRTFEAGEQIDLLLNLNQFVLLN